MAALDHGVSEIELPIEFQSARVDGQRARCCSWFGSLVDDAWLEAELAQPESKDQTGRASPDDQNIAARQYRLPLGSRAPSHVVCSPAIGHHKHISRGLRLSFY